MAACKEVVRSMNAAEELSLAARARIRLHHLICNGCSRYAAQVEMMKAGFRKVFLEDTRVDQGEVKSLEDDVIRKVSSSPRE